MKPGEAKRVETNLLMQEEVFEKSYTSVLTGLKHTDQKFLNNMKQTQSLTDSERIKETQHVRKSLLAIVMVIEKLKQNMKDEVYLEEHDTDHFKKHLINIEENIASFKSLINEQLEVLQQKEHELQQSIHSLMERTKESPGMSVHPDNASVRLQTQPKVDTHISELHPDIQEFQLFVQNRGGHTGGWETNDHLLFTRLLQKYRGSDQMTLTLLDLMPDKTAEEIAEHESWYHDYLTLKEAHRKAIQEWRDDQRTSRQKQKAQEPHNVTAEEQVLVTKKFEVKRDPELKEKIKQWKLMQEERQKKEMQLLQLKKSEEEQRWKKKVEYFEQQRKLLAQKKLQRQIELCNKKQPDSAEKQHLHEVQQQIKQARIPLKEFWEQDRQFMQKRMVRLKEHCTSTGSTSSRSSSHSRIQVDRDPSRLLKTTAVWRARTRRSLSGDNKRSPPDQRPLFIADIPHLAIPKWREGVM